MGATADGTKELIAVVDGVREGELSWKEVLLSLKSRGLEHDPELAIGDGALGFWKALREVFPDTREQRCTVHKTANVLNKLPKSIQPQAKRVLHDIWQAPARAEADKAFDLFLNTFEAKYPRAATCLEKDRTELLAFYDFPAENWCHIRTTNPIESTFATIRLRKTRGWRKLRGHTHLKDLLRGVRFIDGENEHTLKEKKLQRSSETTSPKETAV